MVRAFAVKLLGIAWVVSCLRFLPAPCGLVCGVLGATIAVLFLVQAVCRPGSHFFLPVTHREKIATRKLAITFDDGPDPDVTPRLLDLLKAHGARASFFFVGSRAETYPEIVQRAYDEGHDIGTHTYAHRTLFHFGTRAFVFGEVQRGIDVVKKILGKTPRFFRPPQGLRTPLSARVLSSYRGLSFFTWTARANDSLATTKERILARLRPAMVPGSILALHDGKGLLGGHDREPTLAAVAVLLDACAKQEVACVTLSELTGRPAYGTVTYLGSVEGTPEDRQRYPLKYRIPRPLYAFWRVFRTGATGSAFALFWVGAVIFAWTAIPIAALRGGVREVRVQRYHRMLRWCFKVFHGYMRLLGLIDSRALSPLPPREPNTSRGRVLVANHQTLVDMTAIVAAHPNVVCVAKRGYVANLWMGRILRACGFISAGSSAVEHQSMLDQCEASLALGFDVLVFPEGTRSIPGSLHPFRRGAFEVACRSKADVVLLEVAATPSALTKGVPFWTFPDTLVAHTIAVLQVVSPASFGYKSRTMCRAVEARFRERLGLPFPEGQS